MNQIRTIFGLLFTLFYLFFIVWLIGPKLDDVRLLNLSELGDFFAGVFGPPAFVWLILGYFQQGYELKQSTEALRVQADELKESVKQQSYLAESYGRLLEIEKERDSRSIDSDEGEKMPAFSVKVSVGSGGSYYRKTLIFKLKNSGYRASNLGFLMEGSKEEILVPVLGGGESEIFKVEAGFPVKNPLNIRVRFTDGLGRKGKWMISIEAQDQGNGLISFIVGEAGYESSET